MAKLKNKNAQVPHGYRFHWAATKWDAQKLMPYRSFDHVVKALQTHVRGNMHQAQQSGMPSDYDSLAALVEQQTVMALQKEGYTNFLTEEASTASPKWTPPPQGKRSFSSNAVGAKTIAGVSTYLEWLGAGGKPVPAPQAEARGSVCVRCPHNMKGDWKTKFTELAAAGIMKVFGMMNDLDLKTSNDANLGLCEVCSCVLGSKVWAPLPHILKHMEPKTKAALWPECWIKSEAANAEEKS